MKLSCTANMVPGKTLTEKAHTVRKLGYTGMAIFVDAPDWKDELLDEMSAALARQMQGVVMRSYSISTMVGCIPCRYSS